MRGKNNVDMRLGEMIEGQSEADAMAYKDVVRMTSIEVQRN